MRRRLTALASLAAIAATLVVWLTAAPVTSAGDPCYHGFAMPGDTTGADVRVTLLPCAFAPTVTSARVGATVTFFNGSDFTHLITGANQSWGSRDMEIGPGKTVSYAFDKAGVYPYACALHRGMSGVIVVGDAVTASSDTQAAISAGGATGDAAPSAATARTTTSVAGAPTTPPTGPDPELTAAVSGLVGALVGGAAVGLIVRRRSGARQDHLTGIA